MASYRFGDIVLINFPFADRNEEKRRPGLVLAEDPHGDLLLARITSKRAELPSDVTLTDWKSEGLNIPSSVRLLKLTTTQESFVVRPLGHLTISDRLSVKNAFATFAERLGEEYQDL